MKTWKRPLQQLTFALDERLPQRIQHSAETLARAAADEPYGPDLAEVPIVRPAAVVPAVVAAAAVAVLVAAAVAEPRVAVRRVAGFLRRHY